MVLFFWKEIWQLILRSLKAVTFFLSHTLLDVRSREWSVNDKNFIYKDLQCSNLVSFKVVKEGEYML